MPNHARPLSPHLQIYNLWKISSLTSILHRLTGLALVAGSVLIVWWLMSIAHGPEAYGRFQLCAQSILGRLVLVGFTWAFWYQLLNGVRHMAWDAGFGFALPVARATGVIVLAVSVLATATTWLYFLGA